MDIHFLFVSTTRNTTMKHNMQIHKNYAILTWAKKSKFTYLQITFLRKGCLSCFTLCTFSNSGQRFARNVYANGYMSLFHLNWIKYLNKYLAFLLKFSFFFFSWWLTWWTCILYIVDTFTKIIELNIFIVKTHSTNKNIKIHFNMLLEVCRTSSFEMFSNDWNIYNFISIKNCMTSFK